MPQSDWRLLHLGLLSAVQKAASFGVDVRDARGKVTRDRSDRIGRGGNRNGVAAYPPYVRAVESSVPARLLSATLSEAPEPSNGSSGKRCRRSEICTDALWRVWWDCSAQRCRR